MLAAGASRLSAVTLDIHLSNDLRSLENRIGQWTTGISLRSSAASFPGIDDDLVDVGQYPSATGQRRFSVVDDELVRAYRSSSGAQVQLYIGYYYRQHQGKELAGETSAALAAAASQFLLKTDSGTLELNEIVREKAGTRHGLIFWYDINGRIVSNMYQAKRYTIWDAVTRRRTNGAVVMIAWEGPAGVESEAAREQAIEFARALIPLLRQYLPS
jgi:EpsI family protein